MQQGRRASRAQCAADCPVCCALALFCCRLAYPYLPALPFLPPTLQPFSRRALRPRPGHSAGLQGTAPCMLMLPEIPSAPAHA